jgi:hypothetical protein
VGKIAGNPLRKKNPVQEKTQIAYWLGHGFAALSPTMGMKNFIEKNLMIFFMTWGGMGMEFIVEVGLPFGKK